MAASRAVAVAVVLLVSAAVQLASATSAGSLAPPALSSTESDVEAQVFENWCKSTAQSHLDAAGSALKVKEDAFNKSFEVTQQLQTKFEISHEAHSGQLANEQTLRDKVAAIDGRSAALEKKKKLVKNTFSKNFDKVNWSTQRTQVETIVASVAAIADKSTRHVVRNALNGYSKSIDKVLSKIARVDAKLDELEKTKRDLNAQISSINAQLSRGKDSYEYIKHAYEEKKKASDAAEADYRLAVKEFNRAIRARALCANKGYLTPLVPAVPPAVVKIPSPPAPPAPAKTAAPVAAPPTNTSAPVAVKSVAKPVQKVSKAASTPAAAAPKPKRRRHLTKSAPTPATAAPKPKKHGAKKQGHTRRKHKKRKHGHKKPHGTQPGPAQPAPKKKTA